MKSENFSVFRKRVHHFFSLKEFQISVQYPCCTLMDLYDHPLAIRRDSFPFGIYMRQPKLLRNTQRSRNQQLYQLHAMIKKVGFPWACVKQMEIQCFLAFLPRQYNQTVSQLFMIIRRIRLPWMFVKHRITLFFLLRQQNYPPLQPSMAISTSIHR